MADRYAVLGNPVKHSLSPKIHRLFAQQFGHEVQYDAIELPLDNFNGATTQLFNDGLKGANVTLPFKQDALAFSHTATQRAQLAGAANTLMMQDSQILADNTDGAGLVRDLKRLQGDLHNFNILLIGAGGATRGVILPLFQAGVAHITIMNRTRQKAEVLAEQFNAYGDISVLDLQKVPQDPHHIIVNCTSSSLHGELPGVSDAIFQGGELAYDMFYQPQRTPFLEQALRCEPAINIADGIGMLVGQAAESYHLWWGASPDIARVIEQLRDCEPTR